MGIIIAALYLVINIIGEILELKGKVVPEFVKIRKVFQRRKKERETIATVNATLNDVQKTLNEINAHYNTDNIQMRDAWIKGVNEKLNQHEEWRQEFSKKLDQNNQDTLELLIENMRSTIIGFASIVSDPNAVVTHEQFNRTFKIHSRYEGLIADHGLTNGEVDIAHRIITEAYEQHMKNHTFLEDLRGYN